MQVRTIDEAIRAWRLDPDVIVLDQCSAFQRSTQSKNKIANHLSDIPSRIPKSPSLTNPLDTFLPEVRKTLEEYCYIYNKKMPILLCASNLCDGESLNEYLNSGADGVAMGVMFLTSSECDLPDKEKEAILNYIKELITRCDHLSNNLKTTEELLFKVNSSDPPNCSKV